MTVLKPAAESRFSVCCVLAQPTASVRSAMTPIRLNAVNMRFMTFGQLGSTGEVSLIRW